MQYMSKSDSIKNEKEDLRIPIRATAIGMPSFVIVLVVGQYYWYQTLAAAAFFFSRTRIIGYAHSHIFSYKAQMQFSQD